MGFGRAGVQLGLTEGRRVAGSNPDLSTSLIGHAKAISYNLASFSWPGWDEQEIELCVSDIAMELDAAKLNLRLTIELKRGAGPMRKAHWLWEHTSLPQAAWIRPGPTSMKPADLQKMMARNSECCWPRVIASSWTV